MLMPISDSIALVSLRAKLAKENTYGGQKKNTWDIVHIKDAFYWST